MRFRGRGLCGRRLHAWVRWDRLFNRQRGDAISIKTFCSMEPCQPTAESSVTQSAAGQRAPFFHQRARIFSVDLTALTEGKCQTGKRDELGEGKEKEESPESVAYRNCTALKHYGG